MTKLRQLLVGSMAFLIPLAAHAAVDSLQSSFVTPPDTAKPQTWWHWMNGNITKEGITADLEAMKDIGLGGATIVNVDCGIPHGNAGFMTPAWRDDFTFAMKEADRLGLKLTVENCAGWSSSGGPWNTPANAMQRITASETRVTGPIEFNDELKQPATVLKYYRDVAVLAFKAPAVKEAVGLSTTPGKLEVQKAMFEPMEGGGGADVTARIVAMIAAGKKSVSASSDSLGGDPAFGQVKRLRLVFTLDGKPGVLNIDENETLIFPTSEALLFKAKSVSKLSVDRTYVHPPKMTESTNNEPVPAEGVIDLTAMMGADGKLKWTVPAGDWVVMRIGYTPTGEPNHPAPVEGRGLECDKMSTTALDAHWDGFMTKVLGDIGPLAGKALEGSLIDSYEVGGQDWTPKFREEFQKRRGYDPLKYLPTYGRHVIDSSAVSERFMWDMRRTVADLFADNYYAHFAELCHQHGLLSAVEPYTGPFESLQCGSTADVVMGEFWTGTSGHPSIKMCASIAHIYGKTIVGAESFTGGGNETRWSNDPYQLKALGDLMFCQGLNRYIFHRYAMQPWMNRAPGMTMGEYGLNFERTQTWWNQGKPWIAYIGRCEYLLQQGRSISDVAYYTGESAPVEMRVGHPAMPAGYDYDAVNPDVLLHGAKVVDRRIVLKSGANYGVLVLPPEDANMTPEMADCISNLVMAGATVMGQPPMHSPSLAHYPACDTMLKTTVENLWGKCDGKTVTENAAGKGRVVWGQSIADVLTAEKLKPDFEYQAVTDKGTLAYTHRVTDSVDIYFVSNQKQQFSSADCTFRIGGKLPELWHPETGVMEPAPIWEEHDGRTTVRLNFAPAESVFVVFRQPAGEHLVSMTTSATVEETPKMKIEIQHAVYAATDGSGELDVTAKLAEMARDGQVKVTVSNDELGKDPAEMHVKTLNVDYTIDGKPGHATVAENAVFMLPMVQPLGKWPQWEAMVGPDGKPMVRAWGNGSVALHTSGGDTMKLVTAVPAPREIEGSWTLNFPPNWGAPATVTLDKLISWPMHSDAGVRYFSGTATYEKTFTVTPEQVGAGRELWLDLGTVKNFADVTVNDKPLGVLWKAPFMVNVSSTVKPGENKLTVKVTNLWPNRIIGDEQLPADVEWRGQELKAFPQWLLDGKPSPTGRFTFATWHHWNKDAKLLESGLIGPVMLRTAEVVPAK